MDLYKHAFRLTPMVCSDLVADCFELARDIRELDMRAAPYDLRDLGFEPVRIETAAGKQEYAAAQRGFAERGAPLRARLIAECERLLAVTTAYAARLRRGRRSGERRAGVRLGGEGGAGGGRGEGEGGGGGGRGGRGGEGREGGG